MHIMSECVCFRVEMNAALCHEQFELDFGLRLNFSCHIRNSIHDYGSDASTCNIIAWPNIE